MRKDPHSELQRELRLYLGRQPDCVVWRNETGGAMTSRGYVSFGLCVGSADIIGVGPGGRFLAIEVKTGAARPSKEQRMFLDLVKLRGGIAGVARSVEDAEDIINDARRRS